jgi:excisionase family DNA binding protein
MMDVLYWEFICTPVGIILEVNPMEPQPKLLYTKREAAQLLSLSIRSIDYLITSCEIASRRVGRRVLIHRDAIERFARQDHFAIRERQTARFAASFEDRKAG